MYTPLKLYLTALPIFFIVDMVWLALIAQKFYAKYIGFLMGPVNWIAALIFYFLFVAGLVIFVIQPAVLQKSLSQALLMGAFFGLVTYATYDLTNLATLKNWPLIVTIVDLAWGTFLGAAVSGLTYFFTSR
jgi:uncharacterized membrane protein